MELDSMSRKVEEAVNELIVIFTRKADIAPKPSASQTSTGESDFNSIEILKLLKRQNYWFSC